MRLRDDLPQEELIGGRDLTSWPSRLGSRMSAAAVASTRLLGPRGVLAMTALLGAVVATGLTVASAAIYDAVDEGEGVAGFDRPALETAISLRTPFNTNVAAWFTQLGGPVGMTVLATCVVVALADQAGVDGDEGGRQYAFAEQVLEKIGNAERGGEGVGGVG